MAAFFEDAVDTVGVADFGVEEAGAVGDGPRDVGGDAVHRVGVGVEDVVAAQDGLVVGGDFEAARPVFGWLDPLDAEDFEAADLALLGTFKQER